MTNFTNVTDLNTTSFTSLLQSLNENSQGWFGNTIPFVVFTITILWFLTMEYKARDSFIFASVSSLIVSVFLRALNLVGDAVLVLFLLLTAIGIFVSVKES